MPNTTLTSRQFDQDTDRAKRAASLGPVFVTEPGEPAYVQLSVEDYRKLTDRELSLAQAVAQTEKPDFDFSPARLAPIARPADLS